MLSCATEDGAPDGVAAIAPVRTSVHVGRIASEAADQEKLRQHISRHCTGFVMQHTPGNRPLDGAGTRQRTALL